MGDPPLFGGGPPQLAGLLRALADAGDSSRFLLAITGAPGSGKSTLAGRLVVELGHAGETAAVVPMDGFHLAQRILDDRGLAEIKGAPETFDAHGYVALLTRLRTPVPGETVYAPTFSRELEEPIGSAIPIDADVRFVITEGNYVLLDRAPWPRARALLDASWYLDPDEDIRINRLVRRHVQFGRSQVDALRRATSGSDADNAAVIRGCRHAADLLLRH